MWGTAIFPIIQTSISTNYCTLKCMLMNCLHAIKKITENKDSSTKTAGPTQEEEFQLGWNHKSD